MRRAHARRRVFAVRDRPRPAHFGHVAALTPAGLGVVDSLAPLLLVSCGVTRSVATLGVLGWRLVSFWLPIPAGAIAYVSLKVPGDPGPG